MHAKHSFEYAVLRAVPRVEREEFVNVGVVLFCKRARFLEMRFSVNEARLRNLHDAVDIAAVCDALLSFQRIVRGDKSGGRIAELDKPERFRWLTAVRSTVLQTSRVHPGLCDDPAAALEKLFVEMVS